MTMSSQLVAGVGVGAQEHKQHRRDDEEDSIEHRFDSQRGFRGKMVESCVNDPYLIDSTDIKDA
jgi:hypothetical protein